jgi:hypothetical protein
MKKLFKTLTIVLLASATTFASVTDDKMAIKKIDTFAVGMYKMKDAAKVRLLLNKVQSNVVTIELTDEAGNLIHREFINKKQTKYGKSFDMSKLKDGTYTFVISDKNEKITRDVTVSTNQPTPRNYRTVKID